VLYLIYIAPLTAVAIKWHYTSVITLKVEQFWGDRKIWDPERMGAHERREGHSIVRAQWWQRI